MISHSYNLFSFADILEGTNIQLSSTCKKSHHSQNLKKEFFLTLPFHISLEERIDNMFFLAKPLKLFR